MLLLCSQGQDESPGLGLGLPQGGGQQGRPQHHGDCDEPGTRQGEVGAVVKQKAGRGENCSVNS